MKNINPFESLKLIQTNKFKPILDYLSNGQDQHSEEMIDENIDRNKIKTEITTLINEAQQNLELITKYNV